MKTQIPTHIALVLCALSLSASVVGAQVEEAAHAHHHVSGPTTRHMADYTIPDIALVREDGKTVSLPAELDDGRPVILNFIYTTCTTICPLTSHTFAELQDKLGSARQQVHMVSISIDPEQDTPAVLAQYAKKFGADKQWRFYTGTVEASVTAQRAFDAYRGDKMNHNPVTFIRLAPGKPWLRIDGFARADELMSALGDATEPAQAHAHHGDF